MKETLNCFEGDSHNMANQRGKMLGFFGLLIGLIAVFLCTFGFFIRIAGNPVGTLYIFVGFFLALIVSITLFLYRLRSTRSDEP